MAKEKRFGLENLIQSTASTTPIMETEQPQKPTYVNSNIPLLEEHHQQLRMIAVRDKKTMRELFTTIIKKYLEENGKVL